MTVIAASRDFGQLPQKLAHGNARHVSPINELQLIRLLHMSANI
ncbi:MAG: hypothetical protein ACI9EF_003791 [Pseudohongiellaceae bacterium]|jgi:hypothetical protein